MAKNSIDNDYDDCRVEFESGTENDPVRLMHVLMSETEGLVELGWQ